MRENADKELGSVATVSLGAGSLSSMPGKLVVCIEERFQRGLIRTAVALTPGCRSWMLIEEARVS
jgi:hypothetical protein